MLLNFEAWICWPQGKVKLTTKGFVLQISLTSDNVMHLSTKVITVHICVTHKAMCSKEPLPSTETTKKKSALKVPKNATAPRLFKNWRNRTRSLPRAGDGCSPTSPNRAWEDLQKWQNIPKSIVCVWGKERERVGASSLTHFYKLRGRASHIPLPASHSALAS